MLILTGLIRHGWKMDSQEIRLIGWFGFFELVVEVAIVNLILG
ncbi:hypothetical protein FBPa8_0019 [Pseudomonas phage vB_PaeP_FBPa8]|nr:hypothetical protein FBPa8_0019 [Pseudomonas phage vB_PaeP_FBPa8]